MTASLITSRRWWPQRRDCRRRGTSGCSAGQNPQVNSHGARRATRRAQAWSERPGSVRW